MKSAKEILTCIIPFIIAGVMVYPFMAIVGASFDPFLWERHDRMFYFLISASFGWMMLLRIQHVEKYQT